MARERAYLFAVNGGEVSKKALARIDLKRMQITAEIMLNCFPRVLGPMQFRAGLGFGASTASDAQARNVPFIFAADDTALVELSNLAMRVIIAGTALTRVSVATVVTNGDFSSAVGWTLTTTSGGVATIGSGVLTLQTPVRGGTTLAKRSVAVAGGDLNKEHGLKIVVTRGPVRFRCGSTDGGDEYIRETELNTGTYSLALTPTGNFFVQLSAESEIQKIVDSITVEAAGVVTFTAPWAAADLRYLRWQQSADVVFVTNTKQTYQPYRIERRSTRSWGLAKYEFKDGPWRPKTANVKLNPSDKLGNITITATAPFFRSTHVGALFRLYHSITEVDVSLGGDDTFTDPVEVVGMNDHGQRDIGYTIGGAWNGDLSLQVSYDDGLTWTEDHSVSANGGGTRTIDGDNLPALVRWGFVGNNYNSGTANISLTYDGGGGWGVVRITGFTSSTSVSAEVVSRLHSPVATDQWEEGRYSDVQSWPSVVELFEGRLWFMDADKLNGTVSDDFNSFDIDEEGDSGPIIRTIATGPVNKGLWMLGLARLVMGTIGAEPVGRSSSFDEPITPENFSIKDVSTLGSADVAAVKIDRAGLFIQRNGKRAYLISFSIEANDYVSQDISRYHPDILNATVIGMAVQRQPDTRLWFWLNDGTAACLVHEPTEDVVSWLRFETDGEIEDIAILPNVEADDVTMIVQRTINAVTKRYRETLAYDTQAEGGTDNYMADSYWTQDLVAASSMTGGTHLIGESVVVWIAGEPLLGAADARGNQAPMTFVVDGAGAIALGASYTGKAIAGLPYEGQWKSSKLAYASNSGSAVGVKKNVLGAQPILYKTHNRGILFGQDFDTMTSLPKRYRMADQGSTLLEEWDDDQFSVPGKWSTDSRICIKMQAPCPATVLAMVLKIEGHENG